jgi:hypothetical protein
MDCAVVGVCCAQMAVLTTAGNTFLQNAQIGAKPGFCYSLEDHALALGIWHLHIPLLYTAIRDLQKDAIS